MTTKRRVLQSQRSLLDQMKLLVGIANDNGLYDVADWLKAEAFRRDGVFCEKCGGTIHPLEVEAHERKWHGRHP